MSFFHKLATNLLRDEINEIIASMRIRLDSHSFFYNQALIRSRLDTTNSFYEIITNSSPLNFASDDSIFDFLSNSISEFQRNMDKINERHAIRNYKDYKGKLMDLLSFIRSECVATDTWNIDYIDSDPLCIFQYRMISYIVSMMNNGDIAQMIRQEINSAKRSYLMINSESTRLETKLDCIQSSLHRIRDIVRAPNSITRIPLFTPFGLLTLTLRPSSLQHLIQSTERQLQELMLHSEEVSDIQLQTNSLFSSSKDKQKQNNFRQLNQERFDKLASNEKLEQLGYKKAAINPDWICSICQALPDDPVSSGSSYKGLYERKALITWLTKHSIDPSTREIVTITQMVPLPHVKEEINKFLTEQEAIKQYFEHCLEIGFTTQGESMALIPYNTGSCFKP